MLSFVAACVRADWMRTAGWVEEAPLFILIRGTGLESWWLCACAPRWPMPSWAGQAWDGLRPWSAQTRVRPSPPSRCSSRFPSSSCPVQCAPVPHGRRRLTWDLQMMINWLRDKSEYFKLAPWQSEYTVLQITTAVIWNVLY
jgi:hypothetical protein